MPISFKTSITGSTSAGTHFSLNLSSTAGDYIVIAVAVHSTSTVTSITDAGGNTYARISSTTNGSSLTLELWSTVKLRPVASGSIQVNLSSSTVAGGVACSYSGVIAVGTGIFNTGTTSPLTTGSIALNYFADAYLVSAGGCASANAFTISSGTLRNQVSQQTQTCIIDSNGASGPVTNSATMTSANWATVSFQMYSGVTVPLGINESGFTQLPSVPFQGFLTSKSESFTAPPLLGTVIQPGGLSRWNNLVASFSNSIFYVQGIEDVNPGNFTLGSTPSTAAWHQPVFKRASQVQTYEMPEKHSSQIRPTLMTLPSFVNGIAERPIISQPQSFATISWDAPSKLGTVATLPQLRWKNHAARSIVYSIFAKAAEDVNPGVQPVPIVLSWYDDKPWNSFNKFQQIEITRQIFPTLGTLPNFVYGLSEIPIIAQPLKFTSTSFDAPAKLGTIATLAQLRWNNYPSSTAVFKSFSQSLEDVNPGNFIAPAVLSLGWKLDEIRQVVSLKFQQIDIARQVAPTPLVLNISQFRWKNYSATSVVSFSFSRPSEDVNPGVQPTPVVLSWYDDKSWNVFSKFQQVEISRQIAPTLATLPSISWYKDSPLSVFNNFQQIETVRQVVPIIPPPPLFSWFRDDSRSSFNKFQQIEIARQISPTLATLPLISWLDDKPWNSFNKFQQIEIARQIFPTLGTLPGIAWYRDASWSSFNTFQQIEISRQIIPTLATLPSFIFGLSELPIKSQPLNFAATLFDSPAKMGTIATIPQLRWNNPTGSFTFQNLYSQGSEEVNPGKPAVIVPLPILLYGMVEPSLSSQPLKFATVTYDSPSKFNLIAIATPNITGWSSTLGQNSVSLRYTLTGYDAPAKFGLVQVSTTFLPSRQSTDGQSAIPPKFSLGNWIAPEKSLPFTAPVVFSWRGQDHEWNKLEWFVMSDSLAGPSTIFSASFSYVFAIPGIEAQPQQFALSSWVSSGFPIIAISPATLASWSPTTGRISTLSNFQQSEVTRPVFSLFSLQFISWIDDRQWSSFSKFQQIEISRPNFIFQLPFISWYDDKPWSSFAKFQQIETVRPNAIFFPFSLASFFSPVPENSIFKVWRQSDYVNQIYPTLATLPTLLFGIAEIPPNSQPQKFAISSWEAPAKFGLTVAAAITIAGWASTLGQNSILLKFALTDYVNQIRPTLATLPLISWLDDKPWSSNLKFQQIDIARPQIIIQPLPLLTAELTKNAQNSIALNYALPTFVTPDKSAVTAIVPALSWSQDGEWVKLEWYMMAETSTGPGAVSSALQAYVSLGLINSPVQLNFASTSYDAPAKFGLVQIAVPTISSWYPTTGQNAVVLTSALTDWTAPSKFGLVVIATPTIAGWLATLGQNAIILNNSLTDWQAPSKFGLIVKVPPTLSSWSPTVGQGSQPQNYSIPSFDGPAKFSLVLLPATVISRGLIYYKVVAVTTDFYKTVLRTAAINKSNTVTIRFYGKLARVTIMDGKISQMFIFE